MICSMTDYRLLFRFLLVLEVLENGFYCGVLRFDSAQILDKVLEIVIICMINCCVLRSAKLCRMPSLLTDRGHVLKLGLQQYFNRDHNSKIPISEYVTVS